LLVDQVLDAPFDVAGYTDQQVQKAISTTRHGLAEAGGTAVAPPPALIRK
jgi:hypothetical protein